VTPIEAIQGHLKALDESLAECAGAVAAQSEATEGLSQNMEEMRKHMGELSDAMQRIEGLLGNFIHETERLRSDVRKKLQAAGG